MAYASIQNTRADLTIRQAMRLLVSMGARIVKALTDESSGVATRS